jgi:hypothetical protein
VEAKDYPKLLEVLENHFDIQELKKIAFLLLGPGSYENLGGKTKIEQAISLIEILKFRNRIDELINYIREFRPDIALFDFEVESPQKTVAQVEFVDREGEIQYILNPFCPTYLLINAPAGYGKTQLLKTLQRQFQSQGWLCVYVKLDRGQSYSVKDLTASILQELAEDKPEFLDPISLNDCGYEIASYVVEYLKRVQANGIILLLDEVETLGEETVKQFFDTVIPALKEGLQDVGYNHRPRVIVAGRYITKWEQIIQKMPLATMSLTPFSFNVVHQSVVLYAIKAKIPIPDENKLDLASHLMYLTGGHPGCMAEFMKHFRPGLPPAKFVLGLRQNEHYKKVIERVVSDIREHIPERLPDAFDTLSVVRRFNTRLLRHFMDKQLIEWSESEHELADALTQTHLVTRESGFLQDDVTRRLLAVRLRQTDHQRFLNTCEEAIAFYEHYLQDPKAIRPEIIAVELLFQKLQYFCNKESCGKEQILGSLTEILEQLVSERDSSTIMQIFLDLLERDWEFRFNFNYLLRDRVYDHEYPYNELIQQIDTFKRGL